MAGRRYWFTGQLVTQQAWRGSDGALEQADRDLAADLGFYGVMSGHAVTAQGPATLSVDVSAGLSYSPLGERMRTAGTAAVSTVFDYLGVPTAVATSGKSKILSLFIIPDRVPSDPQLDATNTTVYFVQDEGYKLVIYQGAEATSNPSPPALLADGILLADITLAYGATSLASGTISTARRQDLIVLTGSPFGVSGTGGRYGSYLAALQAIVSRYDGLVNGTGDTLAVASMPYGGSGTWVNGVAGIAAGSVESGLDGIVAALASTTTSTAGADRIGVPSDAIGSPTLAAGSLTTRLADLRLAANLFYGGGSAWVNGVTNGAQTIESMIDSIIIDLSSVLNSGRGTGAQKIGMRSLGNFTNSSVDGYFAELVATTNTNDGALRIGAHADTGFTGTTVRAQLNELMAAATTNTSAIAAKAPLASPTFTGTVTCSGPLVASTTFGCTGAATFSSTIACNGVVTFTAGATFTGTNSITGASTTTTTLPGTTKLTGRTVERAPVYKSDSSYTLDQNTGGNEIIMLTNPAANRVITLRQTTSPIPENGDWFKVTVLLGTSGFTVALQREGSTDFVAVLGDGVGGAGNQVATVKVKLVAGVWRLVGTGGRYAFYGVDS